MKKQIITNFKTAVVVIAILTATLAESQVVITDAAGGGTADPSAVLDLQSTTKGFLLPRMAYPEMIAIPNPPDGLMVHENILGRTFVYSAIQSQWFPIITDANLTIDGLNDAQSNNLNNSYYIGEGAGTGFQEDANFTTAVGADAGNGFGSGDFNTAIGANSGPASGSTDLHHTTTLGYNAKAENNHEVVLGTTDETVIIPNKIRINSQLDAPAGSMGELYVEEGDGLLYYHNGSDWNRLDDRISVGDFDQGGVVFYVDETGKHGLACNLLDPDPSIRWCEESNNVTYAQGDGIYAGEMNTAIAVAALGIKAVNSAILTSATWRTTSPFSTNYGDWYLPSKEELELMYANKDAINFTITDQGVGTVIGDDIYWSSTEDDQIVNNAYVVDFSDGTASTQTKETEYHMRPIRKF
jgi:hypothetical protein